MDHRKKWDLAEYEKRARERISKETDNDNLQDDHTKRERLKPRKHKLNLETNLNKTQMVANTGFGTQAGYYCNVCDCVVKDSINYLDHVNGKKHQRNMGMSMRVERSSLQDVKRRFLDLKKKKKSEVLEYNLEERAAILAEEDAKLRENRKEKRKEKKRKLQEEHHLHEDSEVASKMGFGGFSGTRRSK